MMTYGAVAAMTFLMAVLAMMTYGAVAAMAPSMAVLAMTGLTAKGAMYTLYGGDGKDYLRGGDDADIFVLGSENDTVVDFTPGDGDKIRVDDFTGAMPGSIEAFLTTANLRVEKGHIKVEGFNSGRDSTATENTAIYRGDTLLMVLEDFTDDLTLDMLTYPTPQPITPQHSRKNPIVCSCHI